MTTEDEERSVFPGLNSMTGETADVIGALTAVRLARGLSQTEVAARMGTSQSALARIESGRSDVRLSTLTRYAAAIDSHIDIAVRERRKE